jgi:succinate dehydrogenase / fumarate reductase, flavoprotein subunit
LRDDKNFSYVASWEYAGENKEPILHKENLEYEFVEVKQRNYK